MKSVEFRSVTKNDVNELFDLFNDLSEEAKKFFHPHSFDKKTLRRIYNSRRNHYFVLTIDGKIIGYSMLRLFNYKIPSFGICIRNGYEKQGYGRMIIDRTMERARELGYQEVILKVHEENNRARNLFIRTDFQLVRTDPKTGEMRMKKSLLSNPSV